MLNNQTTSTPQRAAILIAPMRVQLVFYAFALSLSTAAIKTFSFLSGLPMPTAMYVVGGVMSVVIFSLFAFLMSMFMSMAPE